MVRAFVALIMFALSSQAADLRVDHVTVAGRSVAEMQKRLEALGFKIEFGGPHTNGATEMALASFPDGSYLELIGLRSDADPAGLAANPWRDLINGDAGPAAWAVRPKDFAAEASRIRAAGVSLKEEKSGRKRPDGTQLEWEMSTLGSEARGVFLPFLIHDLTPRDKRAYPSGKAQNRQFSGVLRVVIAVRSLKDATERFSKAYPIGKPLRTVDRVFGAEIAWPTDTPVVFAAPLGANSPVAARLEKFGEGPCAFILAAKKEIKDTNGKASRWFGRDVRWYDPDALGWWLGVQY